MFTRFASLALTTALLAAMASRALAQPADDREIPPPGSSKTIESGLGPPPVDDADTESKEPEQLMQRAMAAFERHRSFSARLRYQVQLFGQNLVGKGVYHQLGYGLRKRLRVEMTMKASGKGAASQLAHVCDGRKLWRFEEVAGQSRLGLVDLERVSRALEEAKKKKEPRPLPLRSPNLSLGSGGLGRLLDDLHEQFEMYAAREDRLGDDPVWILDGRWRREHLARILPAQAKEILAGKPPRLERLAPHLPHEVRLTVSRDGAFLPYRVEFVRTKSGVESETAERVEIVAMDVYEVKVNESLDPQLFIYKPGSVEIVDQTEKFLIQRGLLKKKKKTNEK